MTKAEIASAFSEGKFHQCINYLTDNTIWNTPGAQFLRGKNDIIEFCKKTSEYFDSVTTIFTRLHLIENYSNVAINGTAEFLRDGKQVAFVQSCDVYEFDETNKIVSIISYCITEKPN